MGKVKLTVDSLLLISAASNSLLLSSFSEMRLRDDGAGWEKKQCSLLHDLLSSLTRILRNLQNFN